MPRGRHRHSPPLHRLLPSSVIAGVSVVCAVGPWLFTEPLVLRGLAAGAAATTVLGAIVMRRWDVAAGKHVADLTRARASDEWRHEERVAELESDLEESRELRTKLEQKLRAKRTELAKLRNEHAALLRRYATAETERATALEGRRLLAIEATVPVARALPAGATAAPDDSTARGDSAARDGLKTPDAAGSGTPEGTDVRDSEGATGTAATGPEQDATAEPALPPVFSAEGSALFLRADSALTRLVKDDLGTAVEDAGPEDDATEAAASTQSRGSGDTEDAERDGLAPQAVTENGGEPAVGSLEPPAAEAEGVADGKSAAKATADTPDSIDAQAPADTPAPVDTPAPADAPTQSAPSALSALAERRAKVPSEPVPPKGDGPGDGGGKKGGSTEAGTGRARSGEKGEAARKPAAVAGREHATAPTAQQLQPAVAKPAHGTGHFTVPTAVAVVPAAPPRRPAAGGGFDFFGTKRSGETPASVRNEDLAGAVGQESLAMHKGDSESGFKPADPEARAVGQVIDLTAHDETEQIDIQGLRTAAS
ncbi:hypothetical protein ACWD48_21415 [Streptomyces sp. NPDC002519]